MASCKGEELDMKVNKVGINTSNITAGSNEGRKIHKSGTSSFSDTFGGFERENERQQLEQDLKKINEKGKFIKDKMEIRDLVEYKQMIAAFLERTVKFSHKYSKETKFGRDGSYKVMGIVQKVNQELAELTEQLMNDQKDKINIVEKISGIQGLLVDMLM